ncbi:MAG TPA: YceI family protein [Anaerolineales bacterium]|nr:YceI family protein [Anaerolineales bacterium]
MNFKRLFFWIAGGIAVFALAGLSYVMRPTPRASAPIEAVPLVIATDYPEIPAPTPTVMPNGTPAAPDQPAEAGSEPTAGAQPDLFAPSGTVLFAISQDESQVRFSIDEILNNAPVTAVGVTNQIAGEIAIDFTVPANSQVGVITVNARTLTTDRENRNRMIRNEILDTDLFEFITFTPTAMTGLPAAIMPGQTFTFQITGGLTIRDVTLPVTFEVTASVDADGRLAGYAFTAILRSEYGITIPSVPSVAEVSDEVLLEFDFVAYPK